MALTLEESIMIDEEETDRKVEQDVSLRNPRASGKSERWNIFGQNYPRSEIVFFSQILIILVVISVSAYNLSVGAKDKTLWTALLSSCLGYVLPNPTIIRKSIVQ